MSITQHANAGKWLHGSREALIRNSRFTLQSSRLMSDPQVSREHSRDVRDKVPSLNIATALERAKANGTSQNLLQFESTESISAIAIRNKHVYETHCQVLRSQGDFNSLLFYTVQRVSGGLYVRYIAKGKSVLLVFFLVAFNSC